MEEARAVLGRLDRIEELGRAGATPTQLLEELRALVHEAEAWASRERDPAAREAVARCRTALDEAGIPCPILKLGS